MDKTQQQQTSKPRYAIGIDLGTSHCALAFMVLDGEDPSLGIQPGKERFPEVLEIKQWDSETTLVTSPLLPSWYYLLQKNELKKGLFQNGLRPSDGNVVTPYVVGRFARTKAVQIPGRVIHSAKSWLCASHVDRSAKILPWASSEVVGQERSSPVDIAAAYLGYLKDQWNDKFTKEDSFEYQQITITVPASFDEVAQRLTLDAASKLGITVPQESVSSTTIQPTLPVGRRSPAIRLLEEPQAAFYAWLAAHNSPDQQKMALGIEGDEEKTILVCDIGGGTSDFSLFKASFRGLTHTFERIGVSDHILLGGDNIDLALAHEFEKQVGTPGSLPHRVFSSLTHSARNLKEEILKSDHGGDPESLHTIGVVVGESLFGSTKSVSIQKKQMLELICEGFFPKVSLDQKVHKSKGGLKQLGLPYAEDSAITRHLAAFLEPFLGSESPQNSQKPKVDAVLMVGGTLKPNCLQQRLLEQIAAWQGFMPKHLSSSSMDLAVAQGAALFGYAQYRTQKYKVQKDNIVGDSKSIDPVFSVQLIESGYPRNVYLEIQKEKGSVLVCLIPKGFKGSSDQSRCLALPNVEGGSLMAWTNRPVRFQLWTSRVRSNDNPGDMIVHKSTEDFGDFSILPPLMTILKEAAQSPHKVKNRSGVSERQIPVSLKLDMTETGILSIHCVPQELSADFPEDGWPLDFNVRVEGKEESREEHIGALDPKRTRERSKSDSYPPQKVLVPDEVVREINLVYGKKIEETAPSPKSLIKNIENILGLTRDQWDLEVLRALWVHASSHATRRGRSSSHEGAWLYLAGFCLRPGYGHSHDAVSVQSLWRQTLEGLAFPKERSVQEQYWIMQRRICGGLGADDQTKILAKLLPMIRKGEVPSAEVYKLAGSLERADQSEKIKLGTLLAQQIQANRPQFMDDKIWALARVASRVMLYGEPEHIVQPSFVEVWCNQLASIPTKDKRYPRLNLFWSFAARKVQEREFSLCEEIMAHALRKLVESKAPREQWEVVEKFVAPDDRLKARLFGESLPLGLTIQEI